MLALSHTVIFGQAALGLLLLAGQYRAPVQLHYVYGLAPAAAVLFAYSSRYGGPAPQHARVLDHRGAGGPARGAGIHDRQGLRLAKLMG